MSRERPILFNGAMVRAILSGEKTQTRRALRPQPYIDANGNFCWNGSNFGQDTAGVPLARTLASQIPSSRNGRVFCPFGQPGDRLWVRESWQFEINAMGSAREEDGPFVYAADTYQTGRRIEERWRPSIHMPRWACRLVLEITAVRVERLQAISEADAKAEGVQPDQVRMINLFGCTGEERADAYRRAAARPFRELWTSTGGDWDSNPWVWVIEFKKVTP
ncbi:hypothetical protein [Stenotrophomonas sp.]|uniref:hypothetical protein n=1 Tax=Stenotrophomonas sp. TaxID=69392 RepID=UPI0028AFEDC9|nr:hypothetical protein [Stenotrophomonas sp.]